jgi:hypothetical protein
MPVELPVPTSEATPPKPPRAIVWLGLFVVCILANVVGTLLTWPDANPTSSAWFWVRLLAFPTLAWSLAFGLRLHYYQEEVNRLAAEEDALAEDRATAMQFAREPLAIVGCAYLCSLGNANAANTIAQGRAELGALTPRSGGEAIRHTALSLSEDVKEPGRYRACFMELLDLIADKLAGIPLTAPFSVSLHLPSDSAQTLLLETWETCWLERELRPAQASLLPAGQGLMTVDKWLDVQGGPALEKFTLFISAQLHDTPPQNSAEAAVALLLGWAPLAERRGVKPLAMLHRPVEAASEILNDTIPTALVWGQTTASQIDDLWQAGLEKADKPALAKSASDLTLGVAGTDKLAGIHDVDTAIGHAGVVAGWLAVALAIEHATHLAKPQLIAWRDGTLRFAVVQPAAQVAAAQSSEEKMESTA